MATNNPPMTGAAQRRIRGIASCHRHHPDDHGRGGHEHRTKAGFPGFNCGQQCVPVLLEPLAGIGHDENRICRCRAHRHDGARQCRLRQTRMGQEQRPRDAASAPGNAVMMMKGSSQD